MFKYFLSLFLLIGLSSCANIENEKIDIQKELENNKLLTPPCL